MYNILESSIAKQFCRRTIKKNQRRGACGKTQIVFYCISHLKRVLRTKGFENSRFRAMSL